MSAGLIFLASALAAPHPERAFVARVLEYYPDWALSQGEQTSAFVEIGVLPNGRVADCRVLEAVGNARLARHVCAQTIGLKVEPATDDAGQPTYGLFRTRINLTLKAPGVGAIEAVEPAPEVVLSVNRLPDSRDKLDVQVFIHVDSGGVVTACRGQEFANEPVPAAYVAAACRQATGWPAKVLQDSSGAAVAYVMNLRVRFTSSAPTAPSALNASGESAR